MALDKLQIRDILVIVTNKFVRCGYYRLMKAFGGDDPGTNFLVAMSGDRQFEVPGESIAKPAVSKSRLFVFGILCKKEWIKKSGKRFLKGTAINAVIVEAQVTRSMQTMFIHIARVERHLQKI